MAAKETKEYVVKKDGEVLKTYRSLPAAKQLAEKEMANVYCENICIYRTVPDEEEAVAEVKNQETIDASLPIPPAKFRLTHLMNVRAKPSREAEILGTKKSGTVVDVDAVVDDWMYLSDGTYILYNGGKFAEKVTEA